MWLLSLHSVAVAQEVPETNLQLYRTSVDSTKTMWTDDARVGDDQTGQASMVLGYTNRPLVFYTADDEEIAIVSDAFQANVLGAINFGPVRAGVDVPLYLYSGSDVLDNSAGLGDIALDVKGSVLDGGAYPLGVAVALRGILPSATIDGPLATGGVGYELSGIIDREFDELLLAANIGTRGMPASTLDDLELNDQFIYRFGAGYSVTDTSGVSGELAGNVAYSIPLSNPAGSPAEVMFGGWNQVTDMVTLRGGVGTAVSRGIGAPAFRAVAAMTVAPASMKDTDLDGIVDREDMCPTDPEDKDGYQDTEGCPDPSYKVHVTVVDPKERPVQGAKVTIADGPGEGARGGADFEAMLHPGVFEVSVQADGYHDKSLALDVPASGPTDFVITIDPDVITGSVRLAVTDNAGASMKAWYWVEGEERTITDLRGNAEFVLPVGNHTITVGADDFRNIEQTFAVSEGVVTELDISLAPGQRVQVSGDRLTVSEKIFFDTAKSTISSQSFSILDEIAAVLKGNESIRLLRIEGHTDARGNEGYNMRLSRARANAVRSYLIRQGIDANRLEAQGFGEEQPLDTRDNEAAWEKNRRVEFRVVQ